MMMDWKEGILYNQTDEKASYWFRFAFLEIHYQYFIDFLMIIIGLFGMLGNFFIIIIFGRDPKKRKHHWFVIQLGLTELICSILYFILAVVVRTDSSFLLFHSSLCTAGGFLIGFMEMSSINMLVMVSFESCLAICYPFKSIRQTIRRKMKQTILVYVYSLMLTSPPLLGWSRYTPDGHMWHCSFEFISRDPNTRSYLIWIFLLGAWLPVLLIALCYLRIICTVMHNNFNKQDRSICHLNQQERLRRHPTDESSQPLSSVDSSTPSSPPGCHPLCSSPPCTQHAVFMAISTVSLHSVQESVRRRQRELKITCTMLIVVAAFTLSRLPYAVVILVAQFGQKGCITRTDETVSSIFAKMFVIFNPIIYGFKDSWFRQELSAIAVNIRQRIFGSKNTAVNTREDSAEIYRQKFTRGKNVT